jgi:hypothetical protein
LPPAALGFQQSLGAALRSGPKTAAPLVGVWRFASCISHQVQRLPESALQLPWLACTNVFKRQCIRAGLCKCSRTCMVMSASCSSNMGLLYMRQRAWRRAARHGCRSSCWCGGAWHGQQCAMPDVAGGVGGCAFGGMGRPHAAPSWMGTSRQGVQQLPSNQDITCPIQAAR